MKFHVPCILAPVIVLAGSIAVHAAQFGDFLYESRGSSVTITGYTGSGGDVIIPEAIEGLPVTSIGSEAFRDCNYIGSIMIPNSVTSIESYAFYYCTGLTNIVVPNSVNSIGAGTFCSCTGLTSITIPSSVASIPSWTFSGCTGLTNIVVPNSVKSIGAGTFQGCTGLTSITIPDSVTSIGPDAFARCTGLTSIAIPNSVTGIGEYAFWGCTSLTSITIPNGVISIGGRAFSYCTGLTSITVEASNPAYSSLDGVLFDRSQVTLIGYPAGKGGPYAIPNSVTSIASQAFGGCTGLTTITIHNSVTSVGHEAFSDCTSLMSITIPDSVTSIASEAFCGCTSLTGITVEASNPAYSSLDGVLFDRSQVTLIAYPAGKGGPYAIPNSVTRIASQAFGGRTGLTSITIPSNVTSIGSGAFFGCSSLSAIYFEGNAPGIDKPGAGGPYIGGESAIVYYRPGTAGWDSTFGRRPTALWIQPPVYSQWLSTSGLLAQYPAATAEIDDPDQDGMSNYAEMLAGTDATDPASVLMLESMPRPADLTEADRTPIVAHQHAIYFRTVPGKQYGIQWNDSLSRDPGAEWWTVEGLWRTEAVVTATTTQTRFVFDKSASKAFYRVLLAQ